MQLDTVTVTASLMEQSLMNSNRNVQIIGGKELQNAPVNTVAELLDFATGIDARQRGMFGTQTDLSVRGSTFEQVLVLVNGVRLADPQTGHHLMNLPVALEDIERIEILLGGGSYIFGANAFAGAINIITKKASQNSTQVGIDYGSFNTIQTRVQQSLKGKKHQTNISYSFNESDGFKTNTDFRHSNIGLRSDWTFGKELIQIQGGYTNQGFGAQNFYSTNFPDQYEKTRTLFGSLNWQSQGKLRWDKQLYWRRNWDEFQLFREEGEDFYNYQNGFFVLDQDTAPTWYRDHNYHRSDVFGIKSDLSWDNRLGRTAFSLDYRQEQVRSNNLGDSLEEIIEINDSRGSYHLGAERRNLSIAGQHLYTAGKWQVSGALQANHNTDFGWGFYPALNVGFRANKSHKVYANFNRSFRFPSYTDLFYRLGGALGSRDLEQEESNNYEIGYRFFGNSWYGNASLFFRNGTNIIDWTRACESCDLIATNTSRVDIGGLELSVRKGLSGEKPSAGFQFVELSYSYLDNFTEADEDVFQSLYVFDFLQHKLTARAGQKLFNKLSLHYFLSYQLRSGSYRDADTGLDTEYPAVWLVNLSLNYDWKNWQFSLMGQNLLDQRYFDRGNVELPGAWMQAGLRYNIKYWWKEAGS